MRTPDPPSFTHECAQGRGAPIAESGGLPASAEWEIWRARAGSHGEVELDPDRLARAVAFDAPSGREFCDERQTPAAVAVW
jgi:hypothetical protein